MMRLQGKRSVSDHMHEAVNYINHMKNKVQDLSAKRDGLKGLPSSSGQTDLTPESGSSESYLANSIVVRPWLSGIEIVINSRLPLSRVMQVLRDEGLSIVSCSSSKVNGRLIHTLQSEVYI